MEDSMQQRKSWKPILALIGARLSPSLFAYFYHIGILVLYLLVGIVVVLLIISEVIACIIVIQHPIKAILPWLQQHGLTFLEAIAFAFGASVFVYIEAKQAVKHMKGLVALTRADPDQPPPVKLSDY